MKTYKIFAILIVINSVVTIYFIVKNTGYQTFCGTIKYKVEATRFSKYSAHADPIFVVQFEGFTKEIHPTWDDFLSYKSGQKVCYTFEYGPYADYDFMAAISIFVLAAMIGGFFLFHPKFN